MINLDIRIVRIIEEIRNDLYNVLSKGDIIEIRNRENYSRMIYEKIDDEIYL